MSRRVVIIVDKHGSAKLHFVFADVKIGRLLSSAGDDDAIITGGFKRSSEVTAGGGAAESVASRWTEINKAHLGTTRRQPGSGNRTGHTDNDVCRVVGVNVQWQFIEQHVFGEQLSTPILAEQQLFGEIQIGKFPRVEIDAQYFPHVAAGQ